MASARGAVCLTRNTPAHSPFASRKSPKWRGIVLFTADTPGDYRIVKTGIRQEEDHLSVHHLSASP